MILTEQIRFDLSAMSAGMLYGMTEYGGRSNVGVLFGCGDNEQGIAQLSVVRGRLSVLSKPGQGCVHRLQLRLRVGWNVVFNVLGQQVYSQFLPAVLRDQFSDLSSIDGIYFYRVTDEAGNLIGEGK